MASTAELRDMSCIDSGLPIVGSLDIMSVMTVCTYGNVRVPCSEGPSVNPLPKISSDSDMAGAAGPGDSCSKTRRVRIHGPDVMPAVTIPAGRGRQGGGFGNRPVDAETDRFQGFVMTGCAVRGVKVFIMWKLREPLEVEVTVYAFQADFAVNRIGQAASIDENRPAVGRTQFFVIVAGQALFVRQAFQISGSQ
jgi:hypothetical protein